MAGVADASAAHATDDGLGFAAARWALVGDEADYGAARGAVLRARSWSASTIARPGAS